MSRRWAPVGIIANRHRGAVVCMGGEKARPRYASPGPEELIRKDRGGANRGWALDLYSEAH